MTTTNRSPLREPVTGIQIYRSGLGWLVSCYKSEIPPMYFLRGSVFVEKILKPYWTDDNRIRQIFKVVYRAGPNSKYYYYDWHVLDVPLELIHQAGSPPRNQAVEDMY